MEDISYITAMHMIQYDLSLYIYIYSMYTCEIIKVQIVSGIQSDTYIYIYVNSCMYIQYMRVYKTFLF